MVALMPQGTIPRGPAFFDPELKGRWGAARLAAMTGAPVIPVGLWGTEKVWPRNARLPAARASTDRRRARDASARRSSSATTTPTPTPSGSWRPSSTCCRPRPASTASRPTRSCAAPTRRATRATREGDRAPARHRHLTAPERDRKPMTVPGTIESRPTASSASSSRMSDAEALMWNVEKDPWLNPNGGDAHRSSTARSTSTSSARRMRSGRGARSPGCASASCPASAACRRRCGRPIPSSTSTTTSATSRCRRRAPSAQLLDLATQLYQDPFDRTRPLWIFVVIDGLEGGRGALFWKTHHSISDGIGLVRLSERYMERDADAAAAARGRPRRRRSPTARRRAGDRAQGAGRRPSRRLRGRRRPQRSATSWRRQAGIARRAAGRGGAVGADPLPDQGSSPRAWSVEVQRSLAARPGGGGDVPGRLAAVDKPLPAPPPRGAAAAPWTTREAAAKALGGIGERLLRRRRRRSARSPTTTERDVAGRRAEHLLRRQHPHRQGGRRQLLHAARGCRCPGTTMPAEERFAARTRPHGGQARGAGVTGEGDAHGLAGVANLLPTSVVTRVARAQAANDGLRHLQPPGARRSPLHLRGADALERRAWARWPARPSTSPTVSYNGSLDIGAFIDPAAVEDPADLRDCLETAYSELLEAGGVLRSRR